MEFPTSQYQAFNGKIDKKRQLKTEKTGNVYTFLAHLLYRSY